MAGHSIKLIEDSLENIRTHLSKFGGGSVCLTRNTETGVATILLEHPEKRNALTELLKNDDFFFLTSRAKITNISEIFVEKCHKHSSIVGKMMVELRDCIESLQDWKEGKAVILSGKGGNFCSGADLDFVRENGTPQAGLNLSTWMQDTLSMLHRLPLISVCLIHGPTLGGGAELSVYCDFLVAADNVKYGFVHGKMGIIPAFGGGVRLINKIGQRKALDLLLTAKILTANECLDMGLAEEVVPSDGALAKTMEWLTPRIQHHHTVTRAMKEIILNTYYHTYEDALRLEKLRFAPFWGSEINQEALRKNIKHVKK